MTNPLIDLARRLDRRREETRQRHAFEDALTDPHLARDLGQPHRQRRRSNFDLW